MIGIIFRQRQHENATHTITVCTHCQLCTTTSRFIDFEFGMLEQQSRDAIRYHRRLLIFVADVLVVCDRNPRAAFQGGVDSRSVIHHLRDKVSENVASAVA